MKKPFNRIITIMFENQYRNYVVENPFMKKLASAGADMTNFFGVFHPSQTNYLASIAGEICGVTNDDAPASPLMQTVLVDLLERKKISWKAYMEGYPGDPWNKNWESPGYPASEQPIPQYPPANAGNLSRYYRKHNAFASFHNIQRNQDRWDKIVSDRDFWKDVASGTLPEYSWFTPDIWNDGHYLTNTHIDTNPRTQLVPQISTWIEHVFLGNIPTSSIQGGSDSGLDTFGLNLNIDTLLEDPQKAWSRSNVPEGTLIVITFDEADFDATGYDTNYDGPNQIYTVLLGDMIPPGTEISTPYNHYNLIRTIEENFELGSLKKNDLGANWFRFLWNESFRWQSQADSGIDAGNAIAVSMISNKLHMVFGNAVGELFLTILEDGQWSEPENIGVTTAGPIALAAIGDAAKLVFCGLDGELFSTVYSTHNGWSSACALNQKSSGYIALSRFYDYASGAFKLMLCWQSENGFIQSLCGDLSGFSDQGIPVNQLTDGPMTLGQVGPSVYLVYKERNSRKMRMTSYNVGPFNAFSAHDFSGKPAPENDATLHKWSVTDFAVGNFAKKMASLANEYQSLGQMAIATLSGEMHLVHRGGYTDLPHAYTEVFGLTGINSAASQLSNGYGTLSQAGWTLEEQITTINLDLDSPLAMCSDDQTLSLVWLDANSHTIHLMQGGYRSNSN